MKKYFKKFKGIFFLLICLCISVATFQVGVFAEESRTPVTISFAKLLEEKNEVFGHGILTGTTDNGTADMDDKCWVKGTETNRGYDNSQANDIVRSFDVITYNINTGVNNLGGEAHKIGFIVEIPDDNALDVTSINGQVISEKKENGKKIYNFQWDIEANQSAGSIEHGFKINVGNKHQGETIEPRVTVYVDDQANNKTVEMKQVTVTSAPMYNIVLKKGNLTNTFNVYDFNENANCTINAKDYTDSKVTGFRQVFGVALEIKKPGNGIKGVELPEPSQDFTFDINLSDYKVNGESANAAGFIPLLYYYGPNTWGGALVAGIPRSSNAKTQYPNSSCDDSGEYTITQEGSTLHVKVKNYSVDYKKFPKGYATADNKDQDSSYWDGNQVELMKDGFFSSFQFQVVYPYRNANGDTLMSQFGVDQITANASVTVNNMHAVSETNTSSDKETIPLNNSDGTLNQNTDNKVSETFTKNNKGTRDHTIIYSNRDSANWNSSYTTGSDDKDNDIATVGAKDLAFTATYSQSNVGEADESSQVPLGIEQMVLFDRNTIELKKDMNVNLSIREGYEAEYLYLHHRNGQGLTAESMRSAQLSDFNITDDPTDCDGVVVRYRGCYTNKESTNLNQMTRFFCNVKPNYDLADHVYMITAVTNTWDARDLTDDEKAQILADTHKTSINNITRAEYSKWIKDHPEVNLFDHAHTQATIDHRDYYTVPEYVNKIYNPDSTTHKFSKTSADALYLVPYTVSIQKKVAQKENDKIKTSYNVSKKERYVDYVVASQITFANNVTPDKDAKTTVYYTDTLPKGLSYVDSTLYLDGTYKSKDKDKGTVTGGTKIDPTEVTKNENGTTTLKWEVPNVSLRETQLPQIHYSCKIGDDENPENDVNDQVTLKNNIGIQTTEDQRELSSANDNIASTSITVVKDKEYYLTKSGKQTLELNDTAYFDLTITNNSSSDQKNLLIVDTMPQDGIGGTVMKGQYKISKVTINKKLLKNHNDFKLYYTNDSEYRGKKAGEITIADLTKTDAEGNKVWKEATISAEDDNVINYIGDGLIGSWPTAIVYVDDNLKTGTIAKIKLEYDAKVAEGDKLSNSLSAPGNEGSTLNDETQVKVYKRTLEGTVWVDKDKDGKLGTSDDETLFKGAKVTLLKKDADGNYVPFEAYEEITVDKDGKVTIVKHPTTVETDEKGHYKFEGLPEGEFKVIFESGDESLEDYNITDFNKGNKEQSSKVDTDHVDKNGRKLKSGTITEITMPSIKEMESQGKTTYNLPDQNLGLIEQKVDVPVSKIWDDADNQDGMRLGSVTVRLYADGVKTDKTEVLSSANEWKAKFTNLPQYKDDEGNEIKYTVEEENVPNGYTAKISGDAKNGYNITNTHQTQTIDIPVTKVWNDDNNRDGLRSNEVVVELLANGKETGKQVKLNDANNWAAAFTKLPVKHAGNEIKYTLKEVQVPDGYKSVITSSSTAGFVITNTHVPETVSIKGKKTWKDADNQDGKRPESITIKLSNGLKVVETKTVKASDNWNYSFKDLPKYKDGKVITYTISEDAVEGYTTEYDGFNIINTHVPETVNIEGQKVWDDNGNNDGIRPDKITVKVLNGKHVVASQEVTSENNWKYTFKGLDKYKNGKVITYTISENAVDGYTASYDGYNIKNTHVSGATSVKVTKVWDDSNNQDGKRTKEVTVHLYANGKDTKKTLTLNDNNEWKDSFTDLEEYKNGQKIVYTVEEDTVDGYETGITGSQETGYIITNTHGNETVEVKGSKTWKDHNDQDGVRPPKITIRLLADGEEIAVREVTKATNWTYDFGKLAKYKNGKEITYALLEDKVDGYTTTIKGYNIINRHKSTTPPKPSTDKPSKDDQSSNNDQPTNGSQTPVVKGETKTTNKIKTGDNTHLMIYVLFVVISLMGILFLKKKSHD